MAFQSAMKKTAGILYFYKLNKSDSYKRLQETVWLKISPMLPDRKICKVMRKFMLRIKKKLKFFLTFKCW